MKNFSCWLNRFFVSISARENKRGIGLMNAALGAAIAGVVIAGMVVGGKELIERMRERQIVTSMEKFSQAFAKFEDDFGSMPGDIGDTTVFSGSYKGNADGVLSVEESKRVWNHLQKAGLIKGNYDPASNVPGKGFPAGPLPNSGFVIVEYSSEQLTTIELRDFSDPNNPDGQELISYIDMQKLDQRIDDGNLDSGKIRGSGDSCQTGGTCSPAVVLKDESVSDTTANNGCPIPPYRTIACTDPGTTGTITETCSNGTWTVDQRNCTNVVCVGQNSNGEPATKTTACQDGYVGEITENCSNGQWVVTDNCVIDPFDRKDDGTPDGKVCTPDTEDFLSCTYTEQGYVKRKCASDGSKWNVVEDTCTDITCSGGQKLGETRQQTCESGFNGNKQEICTLLGWQLVSNNCVLNVQNTSTCTPGELNTTRTKKCAEGMSGEITETCLRTALNVTSWVPQNNTCTAAACDGSPLGTVRTSTTQTCPGGNVGRVTETCVLNSDKNSASWQSSTANCTAICQEDYSGYISWPSTLAGQTSTMSCPVNFTGGNITRACKSDGTWAAPSGKCTPTVPTCTGITEGNATWRDGAVAGDVVTGNCNTGYEGAPTRTCNDRGDGTLVGVWGDIGGVACQKFCPAENADGFAWPKTLRNSVQSFSCLSGQNGGIYRYCNADGIWNSIYSECKSNNCSSSTTSGTYGTSVMHNLTWSGINFNTSGVFSQTSSIACSTLNSGSRIHSGTLSRTCNNGAWGDVSGSCTTACGASGVWQQTNASTTAQIPCTTLDSASYTSGNATRYCNANGTWGSTNTDSCVSSCPASGAWPETNTSTTAQIPCTTLDSASYTSGNATRSCNAGGTWGSTNTDSCVRYCPTDGMWLQTDAGGSYAIPCSINSNAPNFEGYRGTTDPRSCSASGTWGTAPAMVCSRVSACYTIPGISPNPWPTVSVGQTSSLACASGAGTRTRACTSSGWSLENNYNFSTGMSNNCACPARTFDINFLESFSVGQTAIGGSVSTRASCIMSGYRTNTVQCTSTGWSPVSSTECTGQTSIGSGK